MEVRIVDIDGSPIWVHTRAQAEWDSEGRATRMYGTFNDIEYLNI